MEFDVLMWDVVMNVNVCGVWFVSNVVLLYFVWLGCGVIVNFVLDIVLWGVLKLFVYVVSKGVVIVMMYVQVCEFGVYGVMVNVIVLGLIEVEVIVYVLVECYVFYLQGCVLICVQVFDDVMGLVLFLLLDGVCFVMG